MSRGIRQVEYRAAGYKMTFCYRDKNSSLWQFRRVFPFIILLCLLVNGVLLASVFRRRGIQDVLETLDSVQADFLFRHLDVGEEDLDPDHQGGSPAWVLIEETRAATAAAGGSPRTALAAEQRKAWDAENPCSGREHLLRLWVKENRHPPVGNNNTTATHPNSTEPSALLPVLFKEYANLHRTCTQGGDIAHVTELYKSGNGSSNPCKFLVVEFGSYGVGNRLLWLVSAYQYALLTRRVLLIDSRSTVHMLVCEPFPGSSWLLPFDFPYSSDERWPMPNEFQAAWDQWETRGQTARNRSENQQTPILDKDGLRTLTSDDIEKEKREATARIRAAVQSRVRANYEANVQKRVLTEAEGSSPSTRPHFHDTQANDGWAPNPRFFCDNEQEHLGWVKWVTLSEGCLYFLPDLFAVPSFQPALEDLFPNRDPVTHLLRQLAVPVEPIWIRVRDLYAKEFIRARKVVGMQVRYRDGIQMYRHLNSAVNERISHCGHDHGLIPDPSATRVATWNGSQVGNQNGRLVIFIASLYPGLRDHLKSVYDVELKAKRDGNPAVKVIQLSRSGFQSFDWEADEQAFMEIICLSLVDDLMTSPQSTYGQIAQALGGLTPWLIDFKQPEETESSVNCVRGQSTDACYQAPIAKFICPFNKDVDGKAMAELAPYLKACQDTDGLQLVPPWSPSLLP